MKANRGLWRIGLPVILFLLPAVAGYFLLRNAVEFFGVNRRTCTGVGRNRNCSTPEGGAQFSALFGGHIDQGYVSSQALLWAARGCFALYGVLLLIVIVAWVGRRVLRYRALRRSGMRGPKARERRRVEQARRAALAERRRTVAAKRTPGAGGARTDRDDDGVDLAK